MVVDIPPTNIDSGTRSYSDCADCHLACRTHLLPQSSLLRRESLKDVFARKLLLLSKGRRERAVYAVIRYTRGRSVFKSSREGERGEAVCFVLKFVGFVCLRKTAFWRCSFEQSNRLKQFTVDTRKEIGEEMNVDVVYAFCMLIMSRKSSA